MTSRLDKLRERGRALHPESGNGHKKDAVDLANLGGGPGERRSMSHRQWLFVVYYMQDPNGTRAATRAGYSKRSAAAQASFLLKTPRIKAAMEMLREVTLDNTEVTIDRLISELTDIALSDTEVRGSDKVNAIKLLFDYKHKVMAPPQLVVYYEADPVIDVHSGDVIERPLVLEED